MKKIYTFILSIFFININAQVMPCQPWPTCTTNLGPVVVYPNVPSNPYPHNPYPYNPGSPPLISPPKNTKPCIGIPKKNPEIAGTQGGKKISGGTYGKTRYDENGNLKLHDGLDIKGDIGENVYSMYDGIIKGIRDGYIPNKKVPGSYGNYVEIESNINGEIFRLKYNHLNSIANIKVGNTISQGQELGKLGNTGNASAVGVIPHVHIQAKDSKGKSIDPSKFLNGKINMETGKITVNCN